MPIFSYEYVLLTGNYIYQSVRHHSRKTKQKIRNPLINFCHFIKYFNSSLNCTDKFVFVLGYPWLSRDNHRIRRYCLFNRQNWGCYHSVYKSNNGVDNQRFKRICKSSVWKRNSRSTWSRYVSKFYIKQSFSRGFWVMSIF